MKYKPFIHPDFLLQNKTAIELFHTVAKDLPVIDYHNHINPGDLLKNRKYENLWQLWLNNDPYKHRLMRINGIPEAFITGNASDWEKFYHWAYTFPNTLGNPLFHWSFLELKRVFEVEEMLHPGNAKQIWNTCNEKLQSEQYRINRLIRDWNVRLICTSDSLLDDLEPHSQVSRREEELEVLPSLRGDAILAFDREGFEDWLKLISEQTKLPITSLEEYQEAVQEKLDHFAKAGCLISDHALDPGFYFELPTVKEAIRYFKKILDGKTLGLKESTKLRSYLLNFLGKKYAEKGWTLQLHIGAQRQTSSRLKSFAGGAGGYACIGSITDMDSICRFLDSLEQSCLLPKIILYTLNPADNEPLASLTGSFAEDGVPGKIQLGPAWWYNDHYDGIERHLKVLSSYGMLSRFIGMTTDSRSPLSFSRHEYFRRVLCNVLGSWVEQGRLPADFSLLSPLVKGISYQNTANWILKRETIYEE